MGITFSVTLKKVKSSSSGYNEKGFRWVRNRRFLKKKSIPRVRNTKKNQKYSLRSKVSLSLVQ